MTEGAHILIVDDDPGLLKLLGVRLRSAGYQVTACESGEQALSVLTTQAIQLVITDLRMDGMDGMALFDAIRERWPGLPVVILTAHGSIPDAVEATRRGIASFITKPFEASELLEQVAQALQLASRAGGEPRADEEWRAEILTRSQRMEHLLEQARLVADSDVSVFIYGQSGTGKELLARALHRASNRADGPFVPVNCAAIPEPLLESELFGHTKGAFTGASRDHAGLFQSAEGGTLFLDEIGDMPLSLQVKLLRALQERQIRPVGSNRAVAVDVRIISATHRDLEAAMEQGEFREDLYYRLNVVGLDLPSLDERREDIPLLAQHFLEQAAEAHRRQVRGFSPDAMALLVRASWPGNVRQLHNVVEQAVALTTTSLVPEDLIQKALRNRTGEMPSLVEARQRFEHDYLAQLLQITEGNVSQAARIAGRNRTEFYKLLHRHSLDPNLFKQSS